jgi:hypothetical protein
MVVESTPKAGPKTVYCEQEWGHFVCAWIMAARVLRYFVRKFSRTGCQENLVKIESHDDVKEIDFGMERCTTV